MHFRVWLEERSNHSRRRHHAERPGCSLIPHAISVRTPNGLAHPTRSGYDKEGVRHTLVVIRVSDAKVCAVITCMARQVGRCKTICVRHPRTFSRPQTPGKSNDATKARHSVNVGLPLWVGEPREDSPQIVAEIELAQAGRPTSKSGKPAPPMAGSHCVPECPAKDPTRYEGSVLTSYHGSLYSRV